MQEKISKFMKNTGLFICLFSVVLFGGNAAAAETDAVQTTADYSDMMLIPYGKTSGIKLFADGIMVVELSAISSDYGERSVAANAGIQVGDMITHVNGVKITSTEHFQSMIDKCNGSAVQLTVVRNNKSMKIRVTPDKSASDGKYRIGAWVRDSMAGIGTITFIDPKTGIFGALGHGICDVDTGKLMPFASGSIVPSTITSIKKGVSGTPGELRGEFEASKDIGIFYSNTDKGIFGKITERALYSTLKPVPVAKRNEIQIGHATIVSNISGNSCKTYEIEITKIYEGNADGDKNMLITVTDKRLLDSTGGIVQGMSGSPVLQNGKLIGAVTHVLVNDPKKGFAIFIDNMLSNTKFEKMPKAA